MSQAEQESQVLWRIPSWFPDLSEEIHNKFRLYLDELLKHNRVVNLLPVKTITISDVLHFADSIFASQLIYNDAMPKEITDFGSGNGFPGMVFAILYPQVQVELVEGDGRKADILRAIVGVLGLRNVTISTQLIEKLPVSTVQFGIVRGLGSLTKTLLLTRKAMQYPGAIYHLKSDNWGIELAEIPSQLCSTFEPSLLGEYKLPVGEVKFAVIKTSKIKSE